MKRTDLTDATLDNLYEELRRRNLMPADLIRELQREGKKIKHLGELTEIEARTLIREASK